MATNEIKVNLDLMNALIKLREAEVELNTKMRQRVSVMAFINVWMQ